MYTLFCEKSTRTDVPLEQECQTDHFCALQAFQGNGLIRAGSDCRKESSPLPQGGARTDYFSALDDFIGAVLGSVIPAVPSEATKKLATGDLELLAEPPQPA
jgi:hypothetical protein